MSRELKDEDRTHLRAAFEMALAHSGLTVGPEELPDLFEGYCGLQGLLAQLPGDFPMAVEPAVIEALVGSKVTR